MAPRVWIMQGVVGDLVPEAQKGFGRLADLYARKGMDFFCTSIREGNHGLGSLHFIGHAFDFRQQGVTLDEMKRAVGTGWDIIIESDHAHAEYDPKKVS